MRWTVRHLLWAYLLIAADAIAADATAQSYPIQMLRWSEDYSYLRQQEDLSFPLSLKYVPFSFADGYVSIGGEYRFREEAYWQPNFGLTRTADYTALANRALLHTDWHFGDLFRMFVQLGYSQEQGRQPGERSFDGGGLDLAQGFLDLDLGPIWRKIRFRVGRQEIAIGRYVTIRDGTTIRRTFDGARVDAELGTWSLLLFGARPTRNRPQNFDDDRDSSEFAAAVVLTHSVPAVKALKFDLIGFHRDSGRAHYIEGYGHELRDSLGVRLYGSAGSWDIDIQTSHQSGRFTPQGLPQMGIDSWGTALESGYTLHSLPAAPRLAVRLDAAEGQASNHSHTLETFDLPYPNLTYLTDAAYIAPRNVWDIDPFVSMQPFRTVTCALGTQFLWRMSSHDAVYSPIGQPIVRPNTYGTFVAAQPFARLGWRPNTFVEFQISAVLAVPGKVVTSAGGHQQKYLSSSVAFRF